MADANKPEDAKKPEAEKPTMKERFEKLSDQDKETVNTKSEELANLLVTAVETNITAEDSKATKPQREKAQKAHDDAWKALTVAVAALENEYKGSTQKKDIREVTAYKTHEAVQKTLQQKKFDVETFNALPDPEKESYNISSLSGVKLSDMITKPVDGKGQSSSLGTNLGLAAVGVAGAAAALGSLKSSNAVNPETGQAEKKKFGFGRVLGVTIGVVATAAALLAVTRQSAKEADGIGKKLIAALDPRGISAGRSA